MRITDDVIERSDPKTGLGTLVGRLVEDGKAYAQAEIGYAKALAGERLREAKTGIIFVFAGLVFIHGALIALFVGLVLSLATLVGPFWAMLIVVLAAGLIGGILARIGIAHFQSAKAGPEVAIEEAREP